MATFKELEGKEFEDEEVASLTARRPVATFKKLEGMEMEGEGRVANDNLGLKY